MRAQTCPASFSTRKVWSTYSRVSTAFRPATTWKQSWSKTTPLYSKRKDSSAPLRRPRMRNSSAALLIGGEAAPAHAVGESGEQPRGVVPADAGVGDRYAARERLAGDEILAAFSEVAFDHHAEDALLAGGELARDVAPDLDLAAELLGRVGVREVDHEVRGEARTGELLRRLLDARAVVVGRFAAAQDDVAVLVAERLEDRRLAGLGHPHERVRRGRGAQRVDRDADRAVGAVLEAHRARQAGCELAMALRLGRARPDRAPGDQELGAARHAEAVDLEQQPARELEALVDGEAAVQARVVDETLPAHGGARLLEVHAHHHEQVVRVLDGCCLQAARVLQRRIVVVDR